eukprot:gnl/TRDRNA2_/TRDRNA2_87011_c0_seq1.p1 gnl/TRDRNA2_/TRDRNA2_87011_c0~~gnl/TRDRNA2_/TRDRNA2_87011_c0_seq1.p1  ORF type:complete len:383 (+),score=75.38 gnl/TRDRNA2_/TRDRNA2_87011_c0_seq1:50-1198(+)
MSGNVPFATWSTGVRALAAESDTAKLTVVAGNEASDADSIVCATVYAYYKNQIEKLPSVPVVACNREDVVLRGETVLLLEMCGVKAEDLVFLNDACADALLARAEKIVLVDHNKATGALAVQSSKITEIVDHHEDLKDHSQVTGDMRRIAFEGKAATAASCTSCICEAFLAAPGGKELLSADNGAVARCLLGVVLIDSVNLDPAAKKVCPRDQAAAEALKSAVEDKSAIDNLFGRLDAAKFDAGLWAKLTVEQCLRYDFKQFDSNGKCYGICSCLCGLSVLAEKAGWVELLQKKAAGFDVYCVLTFTKPDGNAVERQILITSKDENLALKAADFAVAYDSPALQLQPIEVLAPPGSKAYQQGNISASRKQVAPCMGAFCASL